MLFKGFSMAMVFNHWQRAKTVGWAGYQARLITIGTIAGAAALTLQAIVKGENPPNTAEPDFWARSILKGGGMGFYGDFLSQSANTYGTGIVPALMGPLATEAQGMYDLTYGAAVKKAEGKETDEGAHLIRFARDNNPLSNWYTKAAFDHLIWNDLQEAASPGYLDRVKDRAERDRGTSYWWDPHDKLPQAAPDMGTMWNPERGAQQVQKIKDALPSFGSSE